MMKIDHNRYSRYSRIYSKNNYYSNIDNFYTLYTTIIMNDNYKFSIIILIKF